MTACTERAVFVRVGGTEPPPTAGAHERIYVGSETCEALLPSAPQVRRCLDAAAARSSAVTLVTPPCTDEGLARLGKVLDALPRDMEVVFNDWGTLELMGGRFRPVLGRLLLTVRRGFRRGGLSDLSGPLRTFLRHSNLASPELQAFLLERGVRRVELDNVVQGYDLALDPAIRASLYVPFVYIASGRKCLFARMEAGHDETYRAETGCGRPCRDLSLWGQIGDSDERVLISENAHYYENAELPDEMASWNVDRIVDCSGLLRPGALPA